MDDKANVVANETYDASYYATHCGLNYSREEAHWFQFFGNIADQIIQSLRPKRVFDAGCAHGFLVEALWDRGVETFGRDISHFAVSEARPDMVSFIQQGSIADPIEGRYDLVVCIEVLEHMSEQESITAIASIALATDRILFSSSPTDLQEPTHINVKPTIWWLKEFAAVGFLPVTSYDASFITTHAYLLEKTTHSGVDEMLTAFAEVIRQKIAIQGHNRKLGEISHELRDAKTSLALVKDVLREVEEQRSKDITEIKQQLDQLSEDKTTAIREKETALALVGQTLSVAQTTSASLASSEQQRQTAEQVAATLRQNYEVLRQDYSQLANVVAMVTAEQARLASSSNVENDLTTLFAREVETTKLRDQVKISETDLLAVMRERDLIRESTVWRVTAPLRRIGRVVPHALRRGVRRAVGSHSSTRAVKMDEPKADPEPESLTEYEKWINENDTLTTEDIEAIKKHIQSFKYKPLISIVMPTYNSKLTFLREAIASIQAQLYPNWELCIADDASTQKHVVRELKNQARRDHRIKWLSRPKNGHIAAATNSALSLATGEFISLMDHDDVLAANALYEVVTVLNDDRTLDMIYSDEDRMGPTGNRFQPYFKPDWNIELLLGHNCFSHLGTYRRTLVEEIRGFREGIVDGSQDYDLALRCAAKSDKSRIKHIPSVLYHWRYDPSETSFSQAYLDKCVASARRAISDYLESKGIEGAKVGPAKMAPEWTRVSLPLSTPLPHVTVIVPTRDNAALLARCVSGIMSGTDYANLELIIVDNDSNEPQTLSLFNRLSKNPKIKIVKYPGPFNYSAINNMAVGLASGDIIALLNNDIIVKDGSWLREMVSIAVQRDVGAVGAKLLYGDGRIQHAGVVLGVGPEAIAGHFGHYEDENSGGYIGQYALTREVSAVTGACLVMRKEIYDQVGGLDAVNLPVAYNDVDFCLRIREQGLRIIWTPFAELLHYESASRGTTVPTGENDNHMQAQNYMRKRWGHTLKHDPFYNPNFSLEDHYFKFAFPTRRSKPWKKG